MKPTRRIALILALIFLLPALLFSVYEISSLNKDEKMIQEIYGKQLEAILFSVNQYSDDILNSWISKIETGLEATANPGMPARIKDLLSYNPSLAFIMISDSIGGRAVTKTFSFGDSIAERIRMKFTAALVQNKVQIQQLISYKKSGFQKVDIFPYPWNEPGNLQGLVFITEDESGHLHVVGLLIDPEVFVSDLVGPRLQVIAKDQFILSTFRKGLNTPVYATFSADSTTVMTEALTKDFWLFPDYLLAIKTKGSSLQKLIQERTNTNLILLLSLDVVLIIAVVLVFRNVKREVQLAQNKSDFVSNVSHEIRTPLALISMFAETLEMGRVPSEEKKKEYYSIITKETHRLSGIVNKILNFSQTEANKKTLHLEPVQLAAEVKAILTTYDFHLTSKGFQYEFTPQGDIWVRADKEAFTEVAINLIDNAMKYSVDRKRIEISAGIDNDFGFVAVKDYGVGISTMDQKYIFDKFYRVSSGNLAKSRGTGLGLSLVKQLMEAQKGRIVVASEPGNGSTFTAYFPLEGNK